MDDGSNGARDIVRRLVRQQKLDLGTNKYDYW